MNHNETGTQETEGVINLFALIEDLWKGTRKYLWVVIVLSMITAAISGYREYRNFTPHYSSAATFTVNLTESSDGSMFDDNLRASQMSKTFPYIILSSVLRDIIAEDLGVPFISENITAENVEDTNLFTIRVTSYSAQNSYNVLQSVIKNYPKIAETVVGKTNLTLLDESGVPKKPMNRIEYTASVKTGVLPGAALGLLVILVYALTRRTIHKIEDIEKLSSIKNLGVLPQVTFKKRGRKKNNAISLLNDKLPDSYKETIYKIRTRVVKIVNSNNLKSILVTSAIPGEGKSTFALNLALSLAEDDKKVILVDCDLRRPTIKNLISLSEDTVGLDHVLNGEAELTDTIKYLNDLKISVLICSGSMKDSSEIIGTQKMGDIITVLEEVYDYVIIDSAPSAILSDTSDLAKHTDGAIFIIKQDFSKVNNILEGLEHLSESSNIQIIGCVLNGAKTGLTGYGYSYGHDYGKYRSSWKEKEKELVAEKQ